LHFKLAKVTTWDYSTRVALAGTVGGRCSTGAALSLDTKGRGGWVEVGEGEVVCTGPNE